MIDREKVITQVKQGNYPPHWKVYHGQGNFWLSYSLLVMYGILLLIWHGYILIRDDIRVVLALFGNITLHRCISSSDVQTNLKRKIYLGHFSYRCHTMPCQ